MIVERLNAARRPLMTCMVWLCAALVCGQASGLCAQESGSDRGPRQTSALSDILSLPPGDVVPALVRALQQEPIFQHPDWKHRGYSVLLSMNGVASPAGIRQFRKGLEDPVVSCLCVYALGTAPPENRGAAVAGLSDYLDRMLAGDWVPCADTNALFVAIGGLGRSAQSLAMRLQGVVADSSRPVFLRGQAAKTLARVDGLVHFVGFTEKLMARDTIASRLLLSALVLEGEAGQWSVLAASSEARRSFSDLLSSLLDVRPERSYLERVKLGNDAPVIIRESELLKERIEIGNLLVESIGRYQPRYAGDPMLIWIDELRHLVASDPNMSVRLAARTKLVRAEQRMAYFGTQ
jgi:hypothetical protein